MLDILKDTAYERETNAPGGKKADLKEESALALPELIRFRLSLPPEKRLNVLRKKIELTSTCL